MNPYETRKLLNEYLLFHYASGEEMLPWPDGPRAGLDFPARTVTELVDWTQLGTGGNLRALDVGCAVGRATFELSKHCAQVIGIDFSGLFVETAREIQVGGSVAYQRIEEGRLSTTLEARLPDGVRPDQVQFERGDAMNLRPDLGRFDVVLAANLLCRLECPTNFLRRVPGLVRAGGQLILTTPATWLEEYTPRENWPAGETLAFLKSELAPHFELRFTKEMPFLIRETRRKYQWTVALGSRWQRKGSD